MKQSVYLRAAQHVAETQDDYVFHNKVKGCCMALTRARASGDAAYALEQLFYRDTPSGYWWTYPVTGLRKSWRDQQARILALLFMHWGARL